MTRTFLSTTTLILMLVAPMANSQSQTLAPFADVTGAWTGVVVGPNGEESPLFMELEQEGNEISGSLEGPDGEVLEISEGAIDESTITMTVVIENEGRMATLEFAAELIEDDQQMKGTITITFGDMSIEVEFNAERDDV